MPESAMAPSLVAFIAEVLTPWNLAEAPVTLMRQQNGEHLRARVTLPSGQTAMLRERPAHITLADWRMHSHLLGHADWLPDGVPQVLRTPHGATTVHVADRDFSLQTWQPGEPESTLAAVDTVSAARLLGGISSWTQATPPEDLPDRRTSICSDTSTFLPGLSTPRDPERDLGGLLGLLFAENAPGNPVVVHGDPHIYNFLWDKGQATALCDWDDVHLNSPAWDLAYFLTHITFIHWPAHDPTGLTNEARMRERVDIRQTDAIVRAYREGMERPWPRACGWRHALLRSLAVTLRLTVSRERIVETDLRRTMHLARWIADAPEVDDWLLLLTT